MNRLAVLAILLASCAPARPPTRIESRRAPAFQLAPGPPHRSPVARMFQPRRGFTYLHVLPATPGVERYVLGGSRIEARDGITHASDDWIANDVTAVLARGTGWRFVTDHELWDADAFLAPPHRVARTEAGRFGKGTGRPVVIRSNRIEGMQLPTAWVVLDAAFADEVRGVVVVEPGVAYATGDGGSHWQRVLRDDVARSVAATDDRRWVVGLDHAAAIDAAGNEERASLLDVPSLQVQPYPNQRSRSVGAPLPSLEGDARNASVDGTRVFFNDTEYDLVDDAMVAEPATPPPCEHFVRLRDRRFGVCGDPRARAPVDDSQPATEHVFARTSSGSWVERLAFVPCDEPSDACFTSSDGSSVACSGPCGVGARCTSETVVCERDGDAAPFERRAGDRFHRWRLLGYEGNRSVIVDAHTRLDRARVLRGGVEVPLVGSAPAPLLRLDPSSLRLDANGSISFFAAPAGRGHFRALEGRIGESFHFVDDPRDARPITMPYPMRGDRSFDWCGDLAWAFTNAHEIVVRDEGGGWVPLASRTHDPDVLALLAAGHRPRAEPSCSGIALRLYDAFSVVGRGAISMSRYGGLGTRFWRDPVGRDPAATWTCTNGESQPASIRTSSGLTRGMLQAVLRGRQLEFDLPTERSPAHPDGIPHVFRFDWTPALDESRYDDPWFGLDVTPRRALVARYHAPRSAPFDGVWEIYELRPSSATRLAASTPWTTNGSFVTADSIVASDRGNGIALVGGLSAWLSSAFVATFDAAGRYAFSRAVLANAPSDSGPPAGSIGVFTLDAQRGTAHLDDATLILTPLGGEPRDTTVHVVDHCGARAHGDIALIEFARYAGTTGRPAHVIAHYSLDGDAMCFRWFADDGGFGFARSDANGIHGYDRDFRSLVEVSCRRAPR